MKADHWERLLFALRKIGGRLAHLVQRRDIPMAVNIKDPIGGALRDTDLLIAFAAQSYRKIEEEKIRALTEAAEKVSFFYKTGDHIPAKEKAEFWLAYDNLTTDMAPLSAHSIRASMQINCLRFPASLLTPTAYNAAISVIVFLFCLALQGFWVAGKELVERADTIELQKFEAQQKLLRNASLYERTQTRARALAKQRCLADPTCDEVHDEPKYLRSSKLDPIRIAAINTELSIAQGDADEKQALAKEFKDELDRINEKSRPLETLLQKWHSRATSLCGKDLLRFFCPVDNSVLDKSKADRLREMVNRIRAEYDAETFKSLNSRQEPSSKQPERSYLSMLTQKLQAANRLQKLESELALLDSDRFRSIVVEVRLIVANVGTYLIAMAMGILGALTFILRSLSQKLREHTYVPVSASTSIVRVCLGAIAGVFGSLLAPGDPTLKSLPPLFIPFVFGYGIEILFSLLDKVVKTFTQTENSNAVNTRNAHSAV